jgi:Icc-related predicted phosphoesterase
VFIAGNHDWPFYKHSRYVNHWVKHGTYLQDRSVLINGLKFYGSPWQPDFCNWAFNLPRGQRLAAVWRCIPEDTDVLITHTPPFGILDSADRFGCQDLASRIRELPLKLHVFGHVHTGHGVEKRGGTTFVNASICDMDYEPVQLPIIIDL